MISRRIPLITAGVILLLFLILVTLRPTQEKITEEILVAKEQEDESYFDFIAENLAGGGPGKDGIPAIDDPEYLTPEQIKKLEPIKDEDIVYGIDYGGKTLAFPQRVMYWHEIVNEETEDGKISVTYCPLTGSVIGFLDHNLGVSGKLYNSNLVLYDRATDDYIPQILGKAVTGNKGKTLETFPVYVTTLGQWIEKHPDTLVLSQDTGYERDYNDPPYQGYDDALAIWFPVAARSDDYHSKHVVHGIIHEGQSYTVIKENLKEPLEYDTGNGVLTISYDDTLGTIKVSPETMHFDVFWFAWYAYHPDTIIVNR